VLDTHDGIGIVDVGGDPHDPRRSGLLTPEQIHDLVEAIHEHSGGTSRSATGAAASNVDLYQVNSTFFDALGRDDDRSLAARTIQVLLPGIPQIYYVGLLAGTNDMELLASTGVGRDVNRHRYSPEEIRTALTRPAVQRQIELLRWRSTEPAFAGEFELLDSADHLVAVRWRSADSAFTATVDVRSGAVTIER
jgi:sucrose phosphorylase